MEEVDVDVQVPIDELGTEARAEGCRRRVKLSPRLHVALANKDSTSLLLLSLFDHPTRSHGISRVSMELHHASSFSEVISGIALQEKTPAYAACDQNKLMASHGSSTPVE